VLLTVGLVRRDRSLANEPAPSPPDERPTESATSLPPPPPARGRILPRRDRARSPVMERARPDQEPIATVGAISERRIGGWGFAKRGAREGPPGRPRTPREKGPPVSPPAPLASPWG